MNKITLTKFLNNHDKMNIKGDFKFLDRIALYDNKGCVYTNYKANPYKYISAKHKDNLVLSIKELVSRLNNSKIIRTYGWNYNKDKKFVRNKINLSNKEITVNESIIFKLNIKLGL